MLIVGLIFAALAALLHVVIFYMESINWEGPLARKTFGGTAEEARPHAFYAFNQGFYNLFLALQATIGIVVTLVGQRTVGLTLVLAGTAAMLAAAVVLALVSATHRAAAAKQGTLSVAGRQLRCRLAAVLIDFQHPDCSPRGRDAPRRLPGIRLISLLSQESHGKNSAEAGDLQLP